MLQKGKEKRVKNRNSLGLLLSHALRLRNCEYVTRNKFFFGTLTWIGTSKVFVM